jgi:hypothetical protein
LKEAAGAAPYGALLMGILSPRLIEEAVLDGSYSGGYDDVSGNIRLDIV